MFIMGGFDDVNNYHNRCLFFSKYKQIYQKPGLSCPRAFFPSVFCISDSCLYVFGGHDGASDTAACERYYVQENAWREIAPMTIARNGASLVAFDRVIFLFGGSNSALGSLDTIERYAIEFDKWSMPRIKLKEPIQDSIAFGVGGARVLIFGGHCNAVRNHRFDVYDLTCECLSPEETEMHLGHIQLPPVFDHKQGVLHVFQGNADKELVCQQIKIENFLCSCRSVAFTDRAATSDDITSKATAELE